MHNALVFTESWRYTWKAHFVPFCRFETQINSGEFAVRRVDTKITFSYEEFATAYQTIQSKRTRQLTNSHIFLSQQLWRTLLFWQITPVAINKNVTKCPVQCTFHWRTVLPIKNVLETSPKSVRGFFIHQDKDKEAPTRFLLNFFAPLTWDSICCGDARQLDVNGNLNNSAIATTTIKLRRPAF